MNFNNNNQQNQTSNRDIINYHTNNQLSLNNNCEIFRDNQIQFKKSKDLIIKVIKDNTQDEVKQVELAVDKLNNKIKTVLDRPEIKQENDKLEKYHKLMNISLKRAMEVFDEGVKQIKEDNKLTEGEKERYIKLMHEKLMSKLYSPQEIQAFQNMFSNLIVMSSDNIRNQRSLPNINRY